MKFTAKEIAKFKWPISIDQKINASPEEIWSVISNAGNLEDCHPFCEKNPVIEWGGVGAKDVIHYYSGWIMQREFVNWREGVGYDLVIGREGGRQSYVSWRITEEDEGKGSLRITIYPYALRNIPVAVRWIPHLLVIRPAMHSYLKSVLKGFEWFITTGEPVRKDQFGSHKWFSTND